MAPAIKVGTIHWRGDGEMSYPFDIYGINVTLPKVPGVYAWAKRIPGLSGQPDRYLPVYVGESADLSTRVTSAHEHHQCAVNAGATHITFHAHPTNNQAARLSEETAIRHRYNPHCNKQ